MQPCSVVPVRGFPLPLPDPFAGLSTGSVVRDIFAIPEGVDVQKEVDKLIHELQGVGDDLVQFAGYFIMRNAT
jgi:hypothetical protein